MKQFSHLLLLLLLSAFISQCTVQKRLYTRGYHIGYRKKFRSDNSAEIRDSLTRELLLPQASEKNDFNANITDAVSEEIDHSTDTTVAIVNNGLKRDTVYVYAVSKSELGRQKKRTRLIGTGIPALGLGLIATGCLSEATAAGATLGSFLILGAIGWLAAFIAAILLILFLVFLCIPVQDNSNKKGKSGISNNERSALTAILIIIGVIGLAFLITGLNN